MDKKKLITFLLALTMILVARADAYACHSKRIAFRQGKGFGTDDAAVDGDAAALPAVVDLTAVGVAKLNLAITRPADGGGRILSLGADIAAVDDDRAALPQDVLRRDDSTAVRPADGGGTILSLGADIAAVDDNRALVFIEAIIVPPPTRSGADAG